eukprot:Skav233040  [mRNA]  locus=scaffold909:1138323:1139429:- [translate_table: standard]
MLLALRRWQLFDRVMHTELIDLFAVLQAQAPETGWIQQICDDLRRASEVCTCPEIQDFVHNNDVAGLSHLCYQEHKVLTRYGKKLAKTYLLYQKIWIAFRQFQADMKRDLQAFGATWTIAQLPLRQPGLFCCELCAATFDTFAALCSHVGKQHRIVNVVHRYARSSVCRACLKCCNDRDRVIHHLKYYRTGCLLKLILTEAPMSDADLEQTLQDSAATHQTQRKQQRKTHHTYPVVQAHGPLRPWPWERTLNRIPSSSDDMPGLCPDMKFQWFGRVFSAVHAFNIDATIAALEQLPYQPGWKSELMAWFTTTYQPQVHVEDAERFMVLQEAVLLWQSGTDHTLESPPMYVSHALATVTLHQVRYKNVP